MANRKLDVGEEVRRYLDANAAQVASTALRVSDDAKAKAAEVSTTAIAEALKVSTLATQEAAKAVVAAAASATAFGTDMQYLKKDIAEIKDRLDNKYVSKDEFSSTKADLQEVKSTIKWLGGAVVLSVITAVMAQILIK